MDLIASVLPVIVNILLIVLLVVSIILIIKCIYIIDKARAILQNVEDKVNSLNTLFSVIELINTKIATVTDKVTSFVESIIDKLFNKKKKDLHDDEVELEEILKEEGNE